MLPLKAIVAVSQNGVIGKQGKLPWKIPSEGRWFREQTMGAILVMGRLTYESLPAPLQGRTTLVLTNDLSYPQNRLARRVASVNEVLWWAEKQKRQVWVCGGSKVYDQLLPHCSEVLKSVIHQNVEDGDAFFPKLGMPDWVHRQTLFRTQLFHVEQFTRPSCFTGR